MVYLMLFIKTELNTGQNTLLYKFRCRKTHSYRQHDALLQLGKHYLNSNCYDEVLTRQYLSSPSDQSQARGRHQGPCFGTAEQIPINKVFQEEMTNYLHKNEPVTKPKSACHNCDVPTFGALCITSEDQVAAVPTNNMLDKSFRNLDLSCPVEKG